MLLIDYSNMAVAGAMAQGVEVVDEPLMRHVILMSLLGAKQKFRGHETVIAVDSRNYWRREIFPHYKSHRAKNRDVSAFDWDTFHKASNKVLGEIKEVFPYKVIEVDTAEADDIIGVLAMEADTDTVIYGADKDFIQCMRNPNVRIWEPRQKKFRPDMTMFEVEIELFEKICTGDRGDGIPNALSPGDAFAAGIRQKPMRKKMIDNMFEQGVPVTLKPRFDENKTLIDFREIPDEIRQSIRDAYAVPAKGSKGKVFSYLTSKELRQIQANFIGDVDVVCG